MYNFAACAAVAITALIALPGPASAGERHADGVRNMDQIEVSSARRIRHYTFSRRYYVGRYYTDGYHTSYYPPYYSAYYGYVWAPYWRPAPFPFIFGLPGY